MLSFEELKVLGSDPANPRLGPLSLSIPEGQKVALLGLNGSGKSTFLKTISREIAFEGRIQFQSHRPRIGRLAQDVQQSVFSDLTVHENLQLAGARGDQDPHLKEVFENPPRLDQKVRELSGGQKQVLGAMMVLQQEPEILLLDEHTSALDVHTSKRVMNMTLKLCESSKTTVIVVSHDLSLICPLVDRILILNRGRIVLDHLQGSSEMSAAEVIRYLD